MQHCIVPSESHFHPSLTFLGNAWSIPIEWGNIQGSTSDKYFIVRCEKNTLAYYDVMVVTVLKALCFSCFKVVRLCSQHLFSL